MNCYAIVEGDFEAALLERLLSFQKIPGVKVIISHGRSSAIAKTMTALTLGKPTLLVLDTDRQSPESEEYVSELSKLLDTAGPTPNEIIGFTPEAEIVLFDTDLARKFIPLHEYEQAVIEATYRPKSVVQRYIRHRQALIHNLSEEDLAILAEHGLLKKALKFLKSPLLIAT